MLEIYIERWTAADGSVLYPWSVWLDGGQLHYGHRCQSQDDAELEARAFRREQFSRDADRVERL